MPTLDLRTVIFLTGAIGALMSLVFVFMHRSHHHSVQGLREWAAAPLLVFISTLVFGSRGLTPAWFSIIVANLVLVSGLALFLMGTCRFYGAALPRWPWWGLLLIAPLLYLWSVIEPSYVLRLVVVHTFTAALQVHNFLLIWRHDRQGLAARFTLAALGIMAVLSVARIVSTPSLPAGADLLTASALQSVFIGAYGFMVLALSVGFVLLVSERLRAQLQTLLNHDELTGVLSRRALFEQALHELQRAQRTQQPLSLLVMDVDHFKQVNDQRGHLMGDRVLRDFAERVRQELRQVDLIGRFGGEEFVAVLPDTGAADARRVAERIRRNRTGDAALAQVTVSIGLVTCGPLPQAEDPAQTLDTLISRADRALYLAKAAGRDQVAIAQSVG
jgi:diguanylate cyclase (GGDEF)-like protein